jgi:hypothetical protein
MGRPRNFADPTFEPSDQELQQLSEEAFDGIGARNRTALDRLRAEIRRLSKQTVRGLTEEPEQAESA